MANHSYIEISTQDSITSESLVDAIGKVLEDYRLEDKFDIVEMGVGKYLIDRPPEPILNQVLWINDDDMIEVRHGHSTYFARWMCYVLEYELCQLFDGTLQDDSVEGPIELDKKRIRSVVDYLQIGSEEAYDLIRDRLAKEQRWIAPELEPYYHRMDSPKQSREPQNQYAAACHMVNEQGTSSVTLHVLKASSPDEMRGLAAEKASEMKPHLTVEQVLVEEIST